MHTPSNVIYLPIVSRSQFAIPAEDAPLRPTPPSKLRTPARSRREPSSLEHLTDDEIVERVALGDVEAAEILRSRYIARLKRAAMVILADERESRRAVDVALEEACSGWPPERGRVDRWLLRLVRRAAVARRQSLWGRDTSSDVALQRIRLSRRMKSRNASH